jgi:ABC-type amino acid transport substrate-binding protein
MKSYNQFINILIIAVIALLLAGCGSSSSTLRIGVDATNPPMEFLTPDGDLTGFDIELVELVAADANLEIEWVPLLFNQFLDALVQGDVDITIVGNEIPIQITEDYIFQEQLITTAFEKLDFSDSYLVNEALMLTREGQRTNQIKKVGYLAGQFAMQPSETAQWEDFELIRFPTIEAGLTALLEEQVGAMLAPKFQSVSILSSDFQQLDQRVLEYEHYRVTASKDSELISTLNTSLQNIIDNGDYATLYQKWFNEDVPFAFLPNEQRDEALFQQAEELLDLGKVIADVNRDCITTDYPDCKVAIAEETLAKAHSIDAHPQLQELHTALLEFGETTIPFLEDPLDSNTAYKSFEATSTYKSISDRVSNTFIRKTGTDFLKALTADDDSSE